MAPPAAAAGAPLSTPPYAWGKLRAGPSVGFPTPRRARKLDHRGLRCNSSLRRHHRLARRFAAPSGGFWTQAVPVEPLLAANSALLAGILALALVLGALLSLLPGRRRPPAPTARPPAEGRELPRKESVEWVNMVVGKLWRIYGEGIGDWVAESLQPVLDDLERPPWLDGVEVQRCWMGTEAVAVRSVERRTSRMDHDLRYHIGIRYTGDARMLWNLKLNCGFFPLRVPVWIRDIDIDGELWVNLRLISTEPWIGAMSWAFVSLPKIKFALLPFRLFNLMGVPVLSFFLQKLFTEDLPRLFVRPNKVVIDFVNGKSLGPIPGGYEPIRSMEEKKEYVGELSITLMDAQKLSHFSLVKSDPRVTLSLGDQIFNSKKNSQTTVVGPPGEPVWNQDFHMLVKNPRTEKLKIQVRDLAGFIDYTVGTAEINLGSLKDTVPVDKRVALRGSWTPWNKGLAGELSLRLTYKAYVEDEEDEEFETIEGAPFDGGCSFHEQNRSDCSHRRKKMSFRDVLLAILMNSGFQAKVASKEESETPKELVRSQLSLTKSHFCDADASLTSSILEVFRESPTIWVVAIASIAVLISACAAGNPL